MDQKEMIAHWIESAEHDRTAMQHLFEKKDYSWSLFVGHLYLEKLLKAYFISVKNEQPPFIHDLNRIAEKAGIELTDDQKNILDTVTTFNLRARYADYKADFYKKCNLKFTELWKTKIEELALWIKTQHLK
ncbi:MAG: HEPN domain-containing protein [Candidatus Delongbacteria bacterium]